MGVKSNLYSVNCWQRVKPETLERQRNTGSAHHLRDSNVRETRVRWRPGTRGMMQQASFNRQSLEGMNHTRVQGNLEPCLMPCTARCPRAMADLEGTADPKMGHSRTGVKPRVLGWSGFIWSERWIGFEGAIFAIQWILWASFSVPD